MKNLQNTKTKLTIIFSLIISILFLIIGNSFFVFKFISDKNNIKQEVENIQEIIKNKENNINTFLSENKNNSVKYKKETEEIDNIINFTSNLFKNIDTKFGEIKKTIDIEEVLVEGKTDFEFFNQKIIIFNNLSTEDFRPLKNEQILNENILYSNIEDYEKIDFKKYINIENGLIFEEKLAVLKTNIGEKKSLIFIEREYILENLLLDILYLFIVIFFFSILFYIIGNIFIKKVLKPVEENIEEMNNFIDNAGHELKTPLAAINSSASLAKELKHFEPELIQEIIDETNKSSEIIGALRSLTKISKNSKIENFGIKSILKEVLISQKDNIKNKKIRLSFDTKNKDIQISANRNYFYILVSNFITNAIKYNKESGNITIEIGDNFLVISDSGIGIPKNETKKIFERFYRTKNHKGVEGYGLGLSMVEKIAKLYNWKIEIESIENIGTKIKILLK
ncbi:MAG: HAMP domain-containing sensor histidine kinase [Candidatus Gracilibacteria bacterium]|nr:HAMP domain-containing sensor histidine kinase [Candidatus Gracilibacteria bacterium]